VAAASDIQLVVLFCLLYVTVIPHGSFLRLWKSFTRCVRKRQGATAAGVGARLFGGFERPPGEERHAGVEKQARNWGMICEGDTIYHFQNVSGEEKKTKKEIDT
jgi:hypothetical protein